MSNERGLPRLGVNIDHIATLRELRGTPYPDLIEAAQLVEAAGAHQITIHLREDRRHIQDRDVYGLREALRVPMNLEMSLAPSILKIARKVKPAWVCLVPERRQEVTTEGGLDVKKYRKKITQAVTQLNRAGVQVSLFIEPSVEAVKAAASMGAQAVEFHTGRFCTASQNPSPKARTMEKRELERIRVAAESALTLGIRPHAGHGLDYSNVRPIVALRRPQNGFLIEEYNIGHVIVCRAALVGIERAVREMLSALHAP